MQDVYICDYIRTPIGRYGGSLSGIRADDLGALPLLALQDRHPDLDWADTVDVIYGCANQAGEDNRSVARMALLLAGLPETVSGTTINRLCGSGMDAVLAAYRRLALGEGDLAIAGGVESMSRAPFVMPKATQAFSRANSVEDTTIGWRFINPAMQARYGTDSMPETAENVAADFNISREDQDAFALRSQERAAASRAVLAEEIVPVAVPQRKGAPVIFDADEHPRATTAEKLAALKAPFRAGGSVTAGNASGVNDGAAALILATQAGMKRHGLTPLARVTGGATAGVAPRIMGMGPAPATERLCAQLGVAPDSFDRIELNEAFAAQALAVLRRLGLSDDDPRVNPHGGAIALGHPLGMSGARITGTAARMIARGEARTALATMCIGVGQGIALSLAAA
ncbi:3-oxoadipyl-CoA thiolase [Mangrovicoccus algicola]|uniref:Beta-ketoadipyl-CoA thiolase n=1 Tax=Mangrovicoccus algicola TaxID=2771008 RepID=A0A8J6YW13_9RHOB|nr:3-oxoadipyl-CoA thiolase [Mangrovicoccus algicola]MBE3638792.1 3-oxoadipyl-CoA thiolase [Mangrovicoccus algicola]